MTIHGYVADAFAGRKWLAKLLAITSLCGLGGTMLAEIDYALTYFVFPALTVEAPKGGFAVVCFVLVLLTAGSYIMWGGYKAAIDTDIFQVKVAYIFIGIVAGALSLNAAKSGNWCLALIISGIVIAFCVYAANRRTHLFQVDPTYETHKFDRGIFYALAVLIFSAASYGFYIRGEPSTGIPIGREVFSIPNNLPLGFGIWGVIALVVTNAMWQLIDISALQRLQSLKFTADNPNERKKLSSGLIAAGVEGTGSWCLVLVLAILTKAGGAESQNILLVLSDAWILVPAFIYIVVAFMLSTLDTLIAASGFVFHYDGTRHWLPENSFNNERELNWARYGTMSCLIGVGILYWCIRSHYGDDQAKLSTIVYAIYAIQASILGPVLVAIFASAHRRNVWFSLFGLLAGWIASFYTTIWAEKPLFNMPMDSWYVFPPFAALSMSVVISIFGCLFANQTDNIQGVE